MTIKAFICLSLSALVLASPPLVRRGGPVYCTLDPSGYGEPAVEMSKKCCEEPFGGHADHQMWYQHYKLCGTPVSSMNNKLDHGQYAKCCDRHGGGSHGLKPMTLHFFDTNGKPSDLEGYNLPPFHRPEPYEGAPVGMGAQELVGEEGRVALGPLQMIDEVPDPVDAKMESFHIPDNFLEGL